jgi:signal transduction histidine kinase/CheY-like chemotaxis protein
MVLAGFALLELAGAFFDAATLAPPTRAPIVALDLVLVGFCLGLRVAFRRGWVRGAAADVVWVALAAGAASDVLATVWLTRQPAYAAFLMLTLVAAGGVLRSLAAFAALASVSVLGWCVVTWRTGVLADAAPHAFGLATASALGAVFCVARLRAHARIAVLRLRDRVRGERLRRALAVARGTLEERERTAAEKEVLRVALLHAQKMEAVGTLAGAVAHDLNNILAAILSAAEMLLADAQLDAAGREDLATIIASARRAADFTGSLLAVGRRGKYASDRLDPGDVVRAALRVVEAGLPVETKLEVELGHGDHRVEGDLEQLTQVVVNLCKHAVRAMPDGGTVWLRTSVVALDGADAHRRAVVPGMYLAFSVTDSGEGMSAEDRQRAFEPFYDRGPENPSTGLALAMAYGAARAHGGIAEIESAPGRGTSVTLYIPRADAQGGPDTAAVHPAPNSSSGRSLRSKSVLLVDDEPSVRAVARRILERMELRVREAENGRRALVAYSADGPFDVAVVDLSMPVMGGKELFARLRALTPDLRVVVVAGADGQAEAMELVAAGASGIVEKPYTPGGLARAVRAALRSNPLATARSA